MHISNKLIPISAYQHEAQSCWTSPVNKDQYTFVGAHCPENKDTPVLFYRPWVLQCHACVFCAFVCVCVHNHPSGGILLILIIEEGDLHKSRP